MAGCSQSDSTRPAAVATTQPQPISPQMVDILKLLAKGHQDKTQLAFVAQFRGLLPEVSSFNNYMSQSQGDLLNQLRLWARSHHIGLTIEDQPGSLVIAADSMQEDEDGDKLLNASNADFQRLYLVMMYMDYDLQIQLDKVALQQVHAMGDPRLQAYLNSALAINQKSQDRIWSLMHLYNLP
ncbi:MAG TPA: hypothetical protein VKJ65_06990 [Phycisphaerae bacterium]|nr:hypothetical protein [Phycisphaerae bacterium]